MGTPVSLCLHVTHVVYPILILSLSLSLSRSLALSSRFLHKVSTMTKRNNAHVCILEEIKEGTTKRHPHHENCYITKNENDS